MITVPGYSNLQVLEQTPQTIIYSARQKTSGNKVVMHHLRPEVATPDMVMNLRREAELLQSLDSPYILKLVELFDISGMPVLVLEHTAFPTLNGQALSIPRVLDAALKINGLLALLHDRGINHLGLCPDDIQYDPDGGSLKLTDISSAVTPQQYDSVSGSGISIRQLAYMSPEQTGRTNRTIDYRSDFYSLGILLYELLTQTLPFNERDSLELVYSHIARVPAEPDTINTAIPRGLSRIVMKLLAKTPEERYQSSYAIARDIEHCLDLVRSKNDIASNIDFEIALDDTPEQLSIPERLLDREVMQQRLHYHFTQVAAGGSSIVACSGAAGTGKTTLISELQKEAIAARGYFVASRPRQVQSGVPYGAIAVVLNDLVRQMLREPDITELSASISKHTRGYEDALIQLAPNLALILTKDTTAEPPHFEPMEARSKIVQGIVGLLRAITERKTPLVLFVDNLQWIDHASIDLFEPIIADRQIPYLMLVVAWRTKELAENNSIRMTVSKIAQSHPELEILQLGNLKPEQVTALLADTLFRSETEVKDLGHLIHSKTQGNPLNVHEFLVNLDELELIKFDRQHREWTWDTTGIASLAPSADVTERLAARIRELDSAIAQLLQVASCIGDQFDLDTLQQASGYSLSETSARAAQAIKEGFLVQLPATDRTVHYRFSHERIQEAAYRLLSTAERRQLHASIGQSYLQQDGYQAENRIFEIVNQLNNTFK